MLKFITLLMFVIFLWGINGVQNSHLTAAIVSPIILFFVYFLVFDHDIASLQSKYNELQDENKELKKNLALLERAQEDLENSRI